MKSEKKKKKINVILRLVLQNGVQQKKKSTLHLLNCT